MFDLELWWLSSALSFSVMAAEVVKIIKIKIVKGLLNNGLCIKAAVCMPRE